MIKIKVTGWCLLIGLTIASAMNSCSKDAEEHAALTVLLKDAPGDFQQVNVEVVDVQVHTTSGGWQNVAVTDSVYDLLLLKDSANAILGNTMLPASKLSQIRLILGSQNSVMVDSVIYPLLLSSQDESGLKININETLVPGGTYTLVLDFDAEASVLLLGNNSYRLKPVLKAEFY